MVFAALTVRFLTASRPFIGGVDFYKYILFARDLAGGATDVSSTRYFYFPGVYSFWKTVFLVTDGSLASLQWVYVGVLITNGVLIGCILASLTRIWQTGVFATSLYVFLASRIEGLHGVTEPIATIPYLLGLWLWLLMSGPGKTHFGLFALASGLGLALFAKQPAGLLSLGILGFLPLIGRTDPPHQYRISHLLILPIVATCAFLFAMWLEGGGLAAMKTGVLYARDLPSEGSWLQHVNRIREVTRPISNFFLSGCAVWLAAVIARKRIPELPDAVMLTLGLSIFSAVACLLQFSKLGHLHYAMLLLPSAIIASSLAIHIVIAFLNRRAHRWPRFAVPAVIVGTAAFLLINSAGTTNLLMYIAGQIASPTRWMQTEIIKKTTEPLCSRIRPGSDLLLIPSRQNTFHWFCRTRSLSLSLGYEWGPTEWGPTDSPIGYGRAPTGAASYYIAAASSPSLSNILVFSEHYGEYEQSFFGKNERTQLLRELERLGFRETFSFEAGQLYQRTLP